MIEVAYGSINLDTSLATAAGLVRVVRRLFLSRALRDLELLAGWTLRFGDALRRQLCAMPYEVLEYDSTLELRDPKSLVAIYRKSEVLVGRSWASR